MSSFLSLKKSKINILRDAVLPPLFERTHYPGDNVTHYEVNFRDTQLRLVVRWNELRYSIMLLVLCAAWTAVGFAYATRQQELSYASQAELYAEHLASLTRYLEERNRHVENLRFQIGELNRAIYTLHGNPSEEETRGTKYE